MSKTLLEADYIPKRYACLRLLMEIFEGMDDDFTRETLEIAAVVDFQRARTWYDRCEPEIGVILLVPYSRHFIDRLPTSMRNTLIAYTQAWWMLDLPRGLRVGYATQQSLDRAYNRRRNEVFVLRQDVFQVREHLLELDLERAWPGVRL